MCQTPQTWQASLPPSMYPAQTNDDVMGWKYVWSQSSLRHTGNWAWRCTVLSLPPAAEMHSNVALYWKCSYCAMLQCTGSVLTVQFISYCEYWTLPKSKYCNENREIYINKQQNGKQESKKWKCVFWHIFCLYFWLYLLGSKHKQMYCEKRKC